MAERSAYQLTWFDAARDSRETRRVGVGDAGRHFGCCGTQRITMSVNLGGVGVYSCNGGACGRRVVSELRENVRMSTRHGPLFEG